MSAGRTASLILCLAATASCQVVQTSQGQLEGHVFVSRGGQNYLVFAGIPFAKPPVGDLRFEAPVAPEPWKGVRSAREHGPMCPQINIYFNGSPTGEEDCLYLTVYTKKLEGKAPVMLHLHGGGWLLGDGPRAKGPEFLMDSDIVIVDINYRIGLLGFLSLEDSVLPGNMGLKDQAMALKWVKENIQNFGGDPDQVTLMGECAGADAVYHHMVSPMSKGLFHRGIAESGSSFTAQAVTPPGLAKQRALRLAEMMGCKTTDSKEILACLKKKDALEIAATLPSFLEWQIDPVLTFAPVLEEPSNDAFLVGPVSGWKANTPLLTGITSGEGLLRTMFFTKNFDFNTINKDDGFNKLMPMSLMIRDTSTTPDTILPKIKEFYLPGNSISMNDFKNLTDMYGDVWFSYGVLEGAKRNQADVYMYYFDYVGDITMSQFFGDKSVAKGAFHTDEALYLWQVHGVPPHKGRDYEISRDLVKLFTNFIMTGNPTPEKDLGVTWAPYMPGENYLTINADGYKMEKGLITDRYNFWNSLNFRDKLK